MAGQNILAYEVQHVESQQSGDFAARDDYDVYVNDYANHGDWYDCQDYH